MSKSAAFINSRRQAGFTMVELAIVLVIAGIILVGALKGTDMIKTHRPPARRLQRERHH
jgi:prepilin-type N-terminal cleavage/methylation domain-containing protein